MKKIVVLDYGTSNLRSVAKALEHVAEANISITVSSKANEILAADRVVFPGQGAIGQSMQSLQDQHLDEVIRDSIKNKPFLGICLGLQCLLDESEEDGGTKGLGIISGEVKRFVSGKKDEAGNEFKIPQMGWNKVYQSQEHAIWKGIQDRERFYFVHSYYVMPNNPQDIIGTTDYILTYTSVAAKDNVVATQFHPEKSQKAGLQLLSNFLQWNI